MKSSIAARWMFGAVAAVALIIPTATSPTRVIAADHGDAPTVGHDQGCDIADVFLFLDPNDNTRVVIEATFRGFIASGENANFGIFDPAINYRFQIENTGDAKPDGFIDVKFSQRISTTEAQIATVKMPNGQTFTAPATNSVTSATAVPFVVTSIPTGNIQFFAGMVDDPFFFDIPAFSRFTASVRAGSPDVTQFNRARDSFAGYNTMSIAISVPAASLKSVKTPSDVLSVNFLTQRGTQSMSPTGEYKRGGAFKTIDRMGNPAVNVALIPIAKKNMYNVATTLDDAKQKFAPDIIASLQGFGTTLPNIQLLASIAVDKGDYLHLNLTVPNTGNGGGSNAEAGYPNGRRLNDDTIDTILTVINNGTPLGDNVNGNGGGTTNTFPFFALPNQPKANGVTDDGTQN